MIYLDISAAVHSKAGLGRYSQRLAEAVHAQMPHRVALFYNQGANGSCPDSLSHIPAQSISLGYKPWRMGVLLGQFARIPFNRLVPEAELFHSTEHLLFPLYKTPTILTVHDLIFKLFPSYHKRLNYTYLNTAMPLFCRRATQIIAVSEATKRDLVTHYQIDPAKINVVYEAAAAHFQPPSATEIARVRQKYTLPDQYLIHLSTLEPRKNLDRLVDTVLQLRQEPAFNNLQLLLAGAKGWLFDSFFQRIADEGLSQIVRPLGWVPDQDLPAVIAAASLAVQPSLYEGFGLPILEHMASGQLVAASNRSSLPEVGGEAAVYFDPEDTGEMVAAIRYLLTDEQARHSRREAGLRQAGRFSWDRAAHETIAVYEKAGLQL